jgi:hypothetical protein
MLHAPIYRSSHITAADQTDATVSLETDGAPEALGMLCRRRSKAIEAPPAIVASVGHAGPLMKCSSIHQRPASIA